MTTNWPRNGLIIWTSNGFCLIRFVLGSIWPPTYKEFVSTRALSYIMTMNFNWMPWSPSHVLGEVYKREMQLKWLTSGWPMQSMLKVIQQPNASDVKWMNKFSRTPIAMKWPSTYVHGSCSSIVPSCMMDDKFNWMLGRLAPSQARLTWDKYNWCSDQCNLLSKTYNNQLLVKWSLSNSKL